MKDVYYHPFEWRKPSVIDPSLPDLGRRGKINLNSYFHTYLWCLKGFMKAFKAFIKPFEAPQRNVKIKVYVNFCYKMTFRNARDGKG